jgi:acetyl/propionyl-CoA carboxylase alpha subunit
MYLRFDDRQADRACQGSRCAIFRMRGALNSFVIRGISSNIPFQSALMKHPRFNSGIFNTGFIAEEYPTGFDASMVPHDDPALLVSVAAYVYRAFTDRSASITGQLQGHERLVSDNWMVVRLNPEGNEHHPVMATLVAGGYDIEYKGKHYELRSSGNWASRCLLALVTVRISRCRSSVTRHATASSIGAPVLTSW